MCECHYELKNDIMFLTLSKQLIIKVTFAKSFMVKEKPANQSNGVCEVPNTQ